MLYFGEDLVELEQLIVYVISGKNQGHHQVSVVSICVDGDGSSWEREFERLIANFILYINFNMYIRSNSNIGWQELALYSHLKQLKKKTKYMK